MQWMRIMECRQIARPRNHMFTHRYQEPARSQDPEELLARSSQIARVVQYRPAKDDVKATVFKWQMLGVMLDDLYGQGALGHQTSNCSRPDEIAGDVVQVP